MPSYDYLCKKCGEVSDIFHGMMEEPHTKCPQCGQHGLIKLISPGAAVVIKGTENPCRGGRPSKKNKKRKPGDKLGEGKHKPDGIPFWRDSDKVNKKVLKNPEKYVKTGEIEG